MSFSLPWLAASALIAFATFLIHIILGGRDSARVLLATDMAFEPKYTHYLCWHMVSITLFAVSVGLGLPLVVRAAWELALAALILTAAFFVWSLLLVRVSRAQSTWVMPQWTLFAAITLTGVISFAVGGA